MSGSDHNHVDGADARRETMPFLEDMLLNAPIGFFTSTPGGRFLLPSWMRYSWQG